MDIVCTEIPVACKTTSTFLLDSSDLTFSIPLTFKLEEKLITLTSGQYRLYWPGNSEFKRIMYRVGSGSQECQGSSGNIAIAVRINGDPEDITMEPHKKSKEAYQAFLWNRQQRTWKNYWKSQDSSGSVIHLRWIAWTWRRGHWQICFFRHNQYGPRKLTWDELILVQLRNLVSTGYNADRILSELDTFPRDHC